MTTDAVEILNSYPNDWPIQSLDMLWPGRIVIKLIQKGVEQGRLAGLEEANKIADHYLRGDSIRHKLRARIAQIKEKK